MTPLLTGRFGAKDAPPAAGRPLSPVGERVGVRGPVVKRVPPSATSPQKNRCFAVDSAGVPSKRRVPRISQGNGVSLMQETTTMAKPATIKIRLNSTAGTGHFYVTKKNARTMTEKMSVKKYDPVKREHVEYKEGKIK